MGIEGRKFASVGSSEMLEGAIEFTEQTKVSPPIRDAIKLYDAISLLNGKLKRTIISLQETLQSDGSYAPTKEAKELLNYYSALMDKKILFFDFLKQILPPDLFDRLMQLDTTKLSQRKQTRSNFENDIQPEIEAVLNSLDERLSTAITQELPAVDFRPPGTPVNKNTER